MAHLRGGDQRGEEGGCSGVALGAGLVGASESWALSSRYSRVEVVLVWKFLEWRVSSSSCLEGHSNQSDGTGLRFFFFF